MQKPTVLRAIAVCSCRRGPQTDASTSLNTMGFPPPIQIRTGRCHVALRRGVVRPEMIWTNARGGLRGKFGDATPCVVTLNRGCPVASFRVHPSDACIPLGMHGEQML